MTDAEKLEAIFKLIDDFGWIDGGHHKQWVLDQILRIVLDDGYDAYCMTYDWEEGIAP